MKILVNGIEKPGELETLLCHAVKGGGQGNVTNFV